MSQAVQSTVAEHANAHEGHSDLPESDPLDLLKSADHAVRRALERKTVAPTTTPHHQELENWTPSMFAVPEDDGIVPTRVLDFPEMPARPSPPVTLHPLQEWEGYVTEINDTDFTANLTDLTAKATHAGEEAIIPLEEISEADAARMQVGSIFHWVIGYERTAGTKKRVSHIVFRDLPRMTASDLEEGREWAEKMARSLSP